MTFYAYKKSTNSLFKLDGLSNCTVGKLALDSNDKCYAFYARNNTLYYSSFDEATETIASFQAIITAAADDPATGYSEPFDVCFVDNTTDTFAIAYEANATGDLKCLFWNKTAGTTNMLSIIDFLLSC